MKTVVELEPATATADLDQFVMHVSEGLPETMTYLSLFTVGQMYYFDNQHSQALSLFSGALGHLPSGEAYQESAVALRFYRGNTYSHLDKHDLAIADYNKAIRLKPDFVEAYNNRGNAYAEKGEHDLAITDYDRAIRLKPNYSLPYHGRGFVYKKRGKKQKAIGDFERFLELSEEEYWREETEKQLRELRGQ